MSGWCMRRGMLCAVITFGLIAYWFGVADRYSIFLYGHVDHFGDLPAQPFDALTSSRYVMAGFTAAGFGAVAELVVAIRRGPWRERPRGANNCDDIARGAEGDRSVVTSRWLLRSPVAVCMGVATTILVSHANVPVLPALPAVAVGVAAAAGYGLVMWLRDEVDGRPSQLIWLLADGAAPTAVFLSWRVVELPERGIAGPMVVSISLALVLCAAAGWSVLVARLRAKRLDAPMYSVRRACIASCCILLLGFPAMHHLHTPIRYRYITAAQNVGGYAVSTWATSGLFAFGVAAAAGCTARLHGTRRLA